MPTPFALIRASRRRAILAAVVLPIVALAAAAFTCRFTAVDCHLCAWTPLDCPSTDLAAGFTEDVVAAQIGYVTDFAFLPDGAVLLARKDGVLTLLRDGEVGERPFLDISARVNNWTLRGALAVEADPQFASNGFVYVLYAYGEGAPQDDGPKVVRLSRFQADGDVAPGSSEKILLGTLGGRSCAGLPVGRDCIPADGEHAGGDIEFADDGTMFVTTGDGSLITRLGTDPLRAQSLDWLAGKVLRVTRDGKGVRSNPFWNGDANANRSKVWAFGLRQPFRLTLRDGTLPYLGDVGADLREEVNVAPRGANLGWPCYEGELRQKLFARSPVCRELYRRGRFAVRFPIYAYATADPAGRGSVTGGTFYTGTSYPPSYRGAYFFADWGLGWIRYLRVDDRERLMGGVHEFGRRADGPVEFEVGPDGDLYYVAINAGELRRIGHEGG